MYAFEELERRYRSKILNQLRRLCHDENEAEDILQDVMMTLYLKLDTFEGKSALSTWIYRITLNAFLMHERKQRRHQLYFTEDVSYEDYSGTPALDKEAETSAYSHMVNNEIQATLSSAVSELPKGYLEVFLMRNKEELPIKEVSRRLGISVPAVKSRNRRARQFLKSRLEGYYSYN
jgi:RNA polymerase sigma-70 factor (ECF subfamily)